jgi:F420-non-reducing hydrogenase small subunit
VISLTCCAGCVSSFLNAGEALLEILSADFDIVYSPTFVDLKEVPTVDLAIVEGGVRTKADEDLIREVRAKSKTLVAIGICATHGGITSLGNVLSLRKLLEKDYSLVGKTQLPELEDLMYPICNFVDVDYYIPGCPPMPLLLVHTLKSIVNGKQPQRHQSVVCTECHRKIVPAKLDRLYGIYEKEADPVLCLVRQGFVCLGSLTRDGCGAPCPRARASLLLNRIVRVNFLNASGYDGVFPASLHAKLWCPSKIENDRTSLCQPREFSNTLAR